MDIKRIVVGALETNCYLLFKESSVLIIDPGDGAEKIVSIINASGYKVVAIILTHGHWDHFGACSALRKKLGAKIYVHELDEPYVKNPHICTFKEFPFVDEMAVKVDKTFTGGKLHLDSFSFEVIHTPGHSRGSSCFYFPEEKILFSGDVLFRGSVGRVDLPCSEPEKMHESIEKIMKLPDEVIVYPGHGMSTTIGTERKFNPFLNFR
jgi:glyoxylase-like metal-dependent hydrolase (beta-lactamase superfamily II)